MSRDQEKVRKGAVQVPGGRVCRIEGIASAKALWQDGV